jgi:hypothetical protein
MRTRQPNPKTRLVESSHRCLAIFQPKLLKSSEERDTFDTDITINEPTKERNPRARRPIVVFTPGAPSAG